LKTKERSGSEMVSIITKHYFLIISEPPIQKERSGSEEF
jgi:hypothetical protein